MRKLSMFQILLTKLRKNLKEDNMSHEKTKNILAVGAHADDLEIGCGGTIARHVQKGDNVTLLIIAKPAYTDYKGKMLRSEEEGEMEEKNGAKVFGVKLINLGFEIKNVQYSGDTVEAINRVIDEYKIDIIYTHWLHDTHQDHMRTTQSVISAGRYVGNILMYEPEYPAGRSYTGFRNQYYIDISETFNIKMEALRQHKSQIKKYGESFLEAVEARARHRGYEIGSKYAECFEVIRLLGNI